MQTTTDDLVLASRLERLRNVILSTYEAPLPEVTVYFYHDEVNGFCIGEIDAYWKLTDGGSGGRGRRWGRDISQVKSSQAHCGTVSPVLLLS